MVTRLVEWLFGLENIRLARDAPLALEWNRAVEAWMLFCFALSSLALIILIYRRERTTSWRRVVLALLRCGIIACVVAVLCRPSLVLQRNRIEPSHIALAVDTSASMVLTDKYRDKPLSESIRRGAGLGDTGDPAQHSRLALVQSALSHDDALALRNLFQRNAVQLDSFAGRVEVQGFFPTVDNVEDLADAVRGLRADGENTDLAGAILRVIQEARGRHLSAIVLATDGQSTQSTSLKDALDMARDRRIPIYPLLIGTPNRPADLEVGPLRAQESVFVNDLLAVEAPITGYGLAAATNITVTLIDERDGTEVASEQVVLDPAQPSIRVELRTKPVRPGAVRYRVEAVGSVDESVTDNNIAFADVVILDTQLHVLYVEGYPRYEYRYLKNALLRERTIELSVLLIEADERFVQEGTDPIRRFPETPEELNRYDVVLFGDVDPRGGWLSRAGMNMLLDYVGNVGGGFGVIAGERFAPHRFTGTPLEKLIPVRIDPAFLGRYDAPLVAGFNPELTAEGRRSRLFRFLADREQSEQLFNSLPPVYWHARTLGQKPGATVLAEHPTARSGSGPAPMVVTGRYGAGKVFFQATDDTWRWRRHTGEMLHDTYWVRVVRELTRRSRVSQDRRFQIYTDRRIYAYGDAVRTRVEILDSRLLSEQSDTIEVIAYEPRVTGGASSDNNETHRPVDAQFGYDGALVIAARTIVHRLVPGSNLFEGTWVPPVPGRFVLRATDLAPRPGQRAASSVVRVERADLEACRPEANHEVLQRIADVTGGRVVPLDQMATQFMSLRDRSVMVPDDIRESLWDSKLALILFVILISGEWILRKVFGLL